jgi:subtilase family serine protease
MATPKAHALAEHNVPKGVQLAADQGRVPANKDQNLTVILKMHNQAAYDAAVKALYEEGSPTFHQWFTDEDFARYAPTAAEFKSVKEELVKQGFSILAEDPQNFSIRVHGTTEITEKAFQTELHTFTLNNSTFQAHVKDAQLTGEAGKLVDSVVGLDRHTIHNQLSVAKNPITGKPLFNKLGTKASIGGELLSEITGKPLAAVPATYTYDTPGASLPVGVYYGNVYSQNPAKIVSYTPKQLQTHYGLAPLYAEGYNGAYQTIALVEGYGYAAAQSDANVAAATFGLPLFGTGNFETVYPEGPPVDPDAADLTGWTGEIALDIQSAHAIAPGARIVVVASAGQDDEDFLYCLNYVISHKLANTVSDSWEEDSEIVAGPAEEDAFNAVLERGAAAGISIQFSSGDGGDEGLETPVGDLSLPSNSPWATAVGGTSILNNPAGGADIVAGWGNDLTYIDLDGPTDPPTEESFFYAGAGGGESIYFAKPSWQSALPGSGRQVPDVSALADPFTGFPIFYTYEGQLYTEAGVGGTSLASPIFSAIWAIADQYNGKPLGLASPRVAKLQSGQITDVLPTSSINSTDVVGTVYDSNGSTFYSADALFSEAYPAQTQTEFPSAIWPIATDEAIAISFGTDSSLTVTPGWDNVTGYGEPNGLPFVQGVTGKTKGASF